MPAECGNAPGTGFPTTTAVADKRRGLVTEYLHLRRFVAAAKREPQSIRSYLARGWFRIDRLGSYDLKAGNKS